ncbi:MAG TPA: hypothetical protein VK735_08755 [Pseudonocardia sp.]|uniref:hypothetical protein n=1 Tax=Pseudonocardia sp. TaxID=60912 RepID=UPI002CCB1A73|nr:hypothetical protein [Pseudonocardia sp.]HTF47522.1 hypothetical protein [Pseudonocardia sp.]
MFADPRPALGEQSSFVNGLLGLASLARFIRALGSAGAPRPGPPEEADDFVHLLLAVVSLGEAAADLAAPEPDRTPPDPTSDGPPDPRPGEWLR